MAFMSLKDIDVSYDKKKQILKGLNLDVEKGELVSLLGPSGCGKSTTLRVVAGFIDPQGGSFLLDGEDMTKVPVHKRNFGLVFQNFNLFPHYSVLKNLMDAPVHVQKRNKEEVKKEAMELLEKMGLSDKADCYPCQLSGGQQQRVAIARALALHPQILFFDEPTSALDPELTGEILKVIRQLASEHMTMVIVTHEMAFARDVADRVIFMDGGYIIEQGDPKEVIEHPKEERTKQFLARFAQN